MVRFVIMRRHRVKLLITLGVLFALVVIVYAALEIYRDQDQLSYFVDLKGEIASLRETVLEESPTHSLLQIDLRIDPGSDFDVRHRGVGGNHLVGFGGSLVLKFAIELF